MSAKTNPICTEYKRSFKNKEGEKRHNRAAEAKKLTITSHTMHYLFEMFLIFSSYYKSRHHIIDAFVFYTATVATRSTAPTGRIVVEHSVVGIAVRGGGG